MTRNRAISAVDAPRRSWRRVLALVTAGAVMGAGLLPIGQAATAAEEWDPPSSYVELIVQWR